MRTFFTHHGTDPDTTHVDNCTHGSLRLVNGTHQVGVAEGRLELCLNQVWGTVCGDQIGVTEATVACRQMEGFSDEGTLATPPYSQTLPTLPTTCDDGNV